MKVLLVWDIVPELVELYILEGELASLAVEAAGCYVNMGDETEAIYRLAEALEEKKPYASSSNKQAFDLPPADKIVIAGFIM